MRVNRQARLTLPQLQKITHLTYAMGDVEMIETSAAGWCAISFGRRSGLCGQATANVAVTSTPSAKT